MNKNSSLISVCCRFLVSVLLLVLAGCHEEQANRWPSQEQIANGDIISFKLEGTQTYVIIDESTKQLTVDLPFFETIDLAYLVESAVQEQPDKFLPMADKSSQGADINPPVYFTPTLLGWFSAESLAIFIKRQTALPSANAVLFGIEIEDSNGKPLGTYFCTGVLERNQFDEYARSWQVAYGPYSKTKYASAYYREVPTESDIERNLCEWGATWPYSSNSAMLKENPPPIVVLTDETNSDADGLSPGINKKLAQLEDDDRTVFQYHLYKNKWQELFGFVPDNFPVDFFSDYDENGGTDADVSDPARAPEVR